MVDRKAPADGMRNGVYQKWAAPSGMVCTKSDPPYEWWGTPEIAHRSPPRTTVSHPSLHIVTGGLVALDVAYTTVFTVFIKPTKLTSICVLI